MRENSVILGEFDFELMKYREAISVVGRMTD